ncbi:MAG: leucine-rich repeat domain-containing protein [Mycoplasmataceae bacterium]|nr:leucine-rich repeat domain-containing protein [Mycoplasmataceae bacterium]
MSLPSSLTKIGSSFLSNCTALTSIDLSPLTALTTIGDSFLSNCYALTSIDLSGLTALTTIGNYFLSYCYSLTSIGNYFLIYCYALTSVTVGDNDFSRQDLSLGTNPMNNITNLSTNTIHGAKAAEFQAKINGAISNWSLDPPPATQ